MGMGKERFQLLNCWISENGITHPVYASNQYAFHLSKFGFDSIHNLLKEQFYYIHPPKSNIMPEITVIQTLDHRPQTLD
jgi:hypothetical protein